MSKDIFIIDRKYISILEEACISISEVLKKADLPLDLLSHKTPSMNTEEYIRFMETIKDLSKNNELPIKISQLENLETFNPPIFAAYCSRNALMCMKRLSDYKKLIGSLLYKVTTAKDTVTCEMTFEKKQYELPEFLVASEMVFSLQLMRNATKKHIVPKEIITRYRLDTDGYEDYFDIRPKVGLKNTMTFSMEDALLPFVSWNDNMWDYFEPELKRRLDNLRADDSYTIRVQTALTEMLPGGESSIDEVSKKLGFSRRTLQRKLSEEGTTFQIQLNCIREKLAKNYIVNFNMTNEEIAYLIGYCDCNSFIRAFSTWTGMSISQYKNEMRKNQIV